MDNSRFNFLGVHISIINPADAVKKISGHSFTAPAYICFPDASVIKEAHTDPLLTKILNASLLTMPDGKPSQIVGRLQGHKTVSTVSGFHLCKALLQTELTHYFYGGSEEIIQNLQNNLRRQFPQARILGYKSPPFVKTGDIAGNEQMAADIKQINLLKPDLIWIGISSPKQDYLMHHFYQCTDKSLMMGVGGVFLYLADESLKSPEWVKKLGLRWAFRLLKEPKRLWPKYYATIKFLVQNGSFFLKLLTRKKK
jgi:N-acetylglucosaminyldiphosphoundecaprenol N-acetyl-beta-D-mannosaminyltransferase